MTVVELIDRAEKYVKDHQLTDSEIGKLFSSDWIWRTDIDDAVALKLDTELASILAARNTQRGT